MNSSIIRSAGQVFTVRILFKFFFVQTWLFLRKIATVANRFVTVENLFQLFLVQIVTVVNEFATVAISFTLFLVQTWGLSMGFVTVGIFSYFFLLAFLNLPGNFKRRNFIGIDLPDCTTVSIKILAAADFPCNVYGFVESF